MFGYVLEHHQQLFQGCLQPSKLLLVYQLPLLHKQQDHVAPGISKEQQQYHMRDKNQKLHDEVFEPIIGSNHKIALISIFVVYITQSLQKNLFLNVK